MGRKSLECSFSNLDRHCDYYESLPEFKASAYSATEAASSVWAPCSR
jgi:hypothetical protein